MIKKEHLSPKKIKTLIEGNLSREEMIAALEHIGECDLCADAFASGYDSYNLLKLPPDFASDVFSVARQMKTRDGKRNKNNKRELFFYSFKVSVAACIALILLFSGTFNYGNDLFNISRITHTDLSGVNKITENLRGFTDSLIDFKVTDQFKGGI